MDDEMIEEIEMRPAGSVGLNRVLLSGHIRYSSCTKEGRSMRVVLHVGGAMRTLRADGEARCNGGMDVLIRVDDTGLRRKVAELQSGDIVCVEGVLVPASGWQTEIAWVGSVEVVADALQVLASRRWRLPLEHEKDPCGDVAFAHVPCVSRIVAGNSREH